MAGALDGDVRHTALVDSRVVAVAGTGGRGVVHDDVQAVAVHAVGSEVYGIRARGEASRGSGGHPGPRGKGVVVVAPACMHFRYVPSRKILYV